MTVQTMPNVRCEDYLDYLSKMALSSGKTKLEQINRLKEFGVCSMSKKILNINLVNIL